MNTESISDRGLNAAMAAKTEAEEKMRKACQEFEGMFMGMIMKQGMKPGLDTEKRSAGSDVFEEFAMEQTARKLGHIGAFGISDMLYDQMTKSAPEGASIEELLGDE